MPRTGLSVLQILVLQQCFVVDYVIYTYISAMLLIRKLAEFNLARVTHLVNEKACSGTQSDSDILPLRSAAITKNLMDSVL